MKPVHPKPKPISGPEIPLELSVFIGLEEEMVLHPSEIKLESDGRPELRIPVPGEIRFENEIPSRPLEIKLIRSF